MAPEGGRASGQGFVRGAGGAWKLRGCEVGREAGTAAPMLRLVSQLSAGGQHPTSMCICLQPCLA